MKPFSLRLASIGALALGSFIGTASAQSAPSPILSSLEVQRLVLSGTPADNVRLGAHFGALADQYAAEARQHEDMAREYKGTTNRRLAESMPVHCDRLADIDRQSAATLKELAAYHEQLGRGTVAAAPDNAAPFEKGAGASAPTDQEVRALAASAHTPADHRVLAEYFMTVASRYKAAEAEHTTMAHTYQGLRVTPGAAHCDRLVQLSRDGAKEATAAAAMHTQLAETTR